MIEASCHCGAVRLEVARPPQQVTDCNCSICRRYGALWAYYDQQSVKVIAEPGALAAYAWGDRSIEFLRCARCGCLTHYDSVQKGPGERRAVNARMLDPVLLDGVRIRHLDGADTWDEWIE